MTIGGGVIFLGGSPVFFDLGAPFYLGGSTFFFDLGWVDNFFFDLGAHFLFKGGQHFFWTWGHIFFDFETWEFFGSREKKTLNGGKFFRIWRK